MLRGVSPSLVLARSFQIDQPERLIMTTLKQKPFKQTFFQAKNLMTLAIREASSDDAEGIMKLARLIAEQEIYSVSSLEEITSSVAEETIWIEGYINCPKSIIIVAEANEKILGICDFGAESKLRLSHTGSLGVGVSPESWGLGIGRSLLSNLLSWIFKNKIVEKVCLTVHADNKRAIALYKQFGFKIEGIKKRDLKYPDHYKDSLMMALFV